MECALPVCLCPKARICGEIAVLAGSVSGHVALHWESDRIGLSAQAAGRMDGRRKDPRYSLLQW